MQPVDASNIELLRTVGIVVSLADCVELVALLSDSDSSDVHASYMRIPDIWR
jgi:hypothetical protein